MLAKPRTRFPVLLVLCLCGVILAAPPADTGGEEVPALTGEPQEYIAEFGGARLEPPFSVRWTFSTIPQPDNITRPVLHGDSVYVTQGGAVRSLDPRTGAERWSFSPEEASIITSPVPWQDLVIVGADDRHLYALDAANSEVLWETTCAGAISPDPIIFDGSLIAGARDMVYSIDPASGQPQWIASCPSAIDFGPITDGVRLYFVGHDGSVQAVSAAERRFRWRGPVPRGPRSFPPAYAERRVIVPGGRGLVGVSATSGRTAWTAELPSGVTGPPAVDGDTLYVPSGDGQLYTLYARSGTTRPAPTYKVPDAITAPPLILRDIIVVGTGTGLLYAMDRRSGVIRWVYRCRSPEQTPSAPAMFGIYAPPLASEDAIYCLTGMGDLFCLSPDALDLTGPEFSEFHPRSGQALPATVPIFATVAITDHGSGIDPGSLTAAVDGNGTEIALGLAYGLATMDLGVLPEGIHLVELTARDYRGNENTVKWSFLTSATIAAPAEPGLPSGAARQTRGGGGGRRGF
jgi:outer membrane protein assembly factor BamB